MGVNFISLIGLAIAGLLMLGALVVIALLIANPKTRVAGVVLLVIVVIAAAALVSTGLFFVWSAADRPQLMWATPDGELNEEREGEAPAEPRPAEPRPTEPRTTSSPNNDNVVLKHAQPREYGLLVGLSAQRELRPPEICGRLPYGDFR